MKKLIQFLKLLSVSMIIFSTSNIVVAQTTVTIGTGSSSSSTRGPVQISGGTSSTQYSRFVQIYTAAELAATGMTAGNAITEVLWELASENTITSGTGTFKVYIKNSAATVAIADSWVNLTTGSTLAVDNIYDVNNNFPGADGWMPFTFMAPFTYTGGSLEIAVDWGFSIPTGTGFTSTDGNGIKWRWEAIPTDLVVKKTSSSTPSTNITDLKSERANIQIVYSASACAIPTALNAANFTLTSADLSWMASASAATYDWKVVATGAGSAGTAIDSGTSTNTMVTAGGLSALTTYDFYVEADCGMNGLSGFAGPFTFTTAGTSTTTVTVGTGTSSSSTRGPFQRSDTNSTTVYSRFNHVYTASELAAAGLTNGAAITELQWDLASSNIIVGAGNANLKVYVKNSTATSAVADTWVNLTTGSTLVLDNDYNTTNNFPGANGWMPFAFSAPFVYTGGSLEIAVDWDCSQVSLPAFSGDGALKWRWEATSPNDLVVKKTSSSSPSTTISDLKSERANIQLVYSSVSCDDPTGLIVTNVTSTGAGFNWTGSNASTAYNWVVVAAGTGPSGTIIDSGMTTDTFATTALLSSVTSYDLYVQADCGSIGTSNFAGPLNFITTCPGGLGATVTVTSTNPLCNGGSDGTVDVEIMGGNPTFTFAWSNGETTEDLTGLAAGNYSVTITDANGCPQIENVTLNEPTALVVTTSSISDTSSMGVGSASAMVTGGTSPYTYEWDGTVGTADLTGLTMGTYFLSVTDANGCSDTVSVAVDDVVNTSSIEYLTSLSITPNPTNGNVMIDLELSQNAAISISVYTITGVLVKEFSQENTSQQRQFVDLSNQSNGIYLVRFVINNQVITRKLVLSK